MNKCKRFDTFMKRSAGNPSLTPVHTGGHREEPLMVTKETIMQVAKISARSTYQNAYRN